MKMCDCVQGRLPCTCQPQPIAAQSAPFSNANQLLNEQPSAAQSAPYEREAESMAFEAWRTEQIECLRRNGYAEAAEKFYQLGSIHWSAWQARASWQRAQSAPVEPKPTGLSRGWNLVRQCDGFVIGHSSDEPKENHKQQALADGRVYVPFMVEQSAPAGAVPEGWRELLTDLLLGGLDGVRVCGGQTQTMRDRISAMLAAAPQPAAQGEFGDAYQGAREDLAIWKRRALEAEEKVRHQEQIIDHLTLEAQGETRMGEPVIPAARQEQGDEDLRRDAERYRWLRNPDRMPHDDPFGHLIVGQAEGEDILWRDALDRQIDLDMAASAEGKA